MRMDMAYRARVEMPIGPYAISKLRNSAASDGRGGAEKSRVYILAGKYDMRDFRRPFRRTEKQKSPATPGCLPNACEGEKIRGSTSIYHSKPSSLTQTLRVRLPQTRFILSFRPD